MGSFNENLETMFSKLDNFVSSKTVVGEPIEMNGITIVPLVDVSFGMGAGSSDSRVEKNGKSSGAGGMGAKITPSAIMVITKGAVQLINVKDSNSVNKLIDMVPGIVNKFSFFADKENNAVENEE
ncbi:MAG: GerW family sporulation protein [Clostridia bacterium]|nr:GerW family sporulation protein [Clostridia bacterium]